MTYHIEEYERAHIVDAIRDTLAELAEESEVSQGVEDKLISSLEILGETL